VTQVSLHKISENDRAECLDLRVAESQSGWVGPNSESPEEAAANSNLVPLAIYDVMARGFEKPEVPMVAFTMYELSAGVGFIRRLMIDQRSVPPRPTDRRRGRTRPLSQEHPSPGSAIKIARGPALSQGNPGLPGAPAARRRGAQGL